MKIMAIDYGDAHTGVAISDRTLTLTGFSTVITAYRPEAVIESCCRSSPSTRSQSSCSATHSTWTARAAPAQKRPRTLP